MSEISNAFEHFIVLLMKSDSHFLNKGDSCISTNSNVRGPKVVIALRSSVFFWLHSLPSTSSKLLRGGII